MSTPSDRQVIDRVHLYTQMQPVVVLVELGPTLKSSSQFLNIELEQAFLATSKIPKLAHNLR